MGLDPERARELAFAGVIDASRDMARRAPGTVVHDEGGVALIAGAHWLPVLINAAARLDPRVGADEVLERADAFFAQRKRGFSVYALADRDEDLVAAADDAGFTPTGDPSPLMAIDEPPATVHVPNGMRIERVRTPDQVAAVIGICSDAYAVYGMPDDVAPAVLSPPSVLLAPHIAAYVAVDDAGPVATAHSLATCGTACLQWVGTRQRAFGRGAGAAVTEAATVGGFEVGASLATLLASPMGAPVYRRLGWAEVGHMVGRMAPPQRTG